MSVTVCAPVVGRSPLDTMRAWCCDAARYPNLNARVVKAAFVGTLGVRLGGPTQYYHELQIQPTLGDDPQAGVANTLRAVVLSRAVQVGVALLTGLSIYRRRL